MTQVTNDQRQWIASALLLVLGEGILLTIWLLTPHLWPEAGLRPVWMVIGGLFVVAMAAAIGYAIQQGATRVIPPATLALLSGAAYCASKLPSAASGQAYEWISTTVMLIYMASMFWLLTTMRQLPGARSRS